MLADEGAIVGDVRGVIRIGEEAAEAFVIGQLLDRDEFQMIERDMRGVEVDRDDLGRVGDQIGKDVAAAARDRRDSLARLDRQRLHVDDRILPDLGIDQSPEGQRESAVEQALLALAILTDDGGGDLAIGLAGHGIRVPGQG